MELTDVKIVLNASTILNRFGISSQNSHEENIRGIRDFYEFSIKGIINKILKGGARIL